MSKVLFTGAIDTAGVMDTVVPTPNNTALECCGNGDGSVFPPDSSTASSPPSSPPEPSMECCSSTCACSEGPSTQSCSSSDRSGDVDIAVENQSTRATYKLAPNPDSPDTKPNTCRPTGIPVPQHGPSMLRTFAMSTTFASIPPHLAKHPEEARVLGNLNETCLHWSCFHRGPAYAILPIAASYPEACGIVGACGRSPLHIVCAGGGRGTVNEAEETVDIVEKLASYNVNMSCLVSVEDGETPISGMWGVYARQCPSILEDLLDKLGVGEDESAMDEEYGQMLRSHLEERKKDRIKKEEKEKSSSGRPRHAAPAAPSSIFSIGKAKFPSWASEIPTAKEMDERIKREESKRSSIPEESKSLEQLRHFTPPRLLEGSLGLPSSPLFPGEPTCCPFKHQPSFSEESTTGDINMEPEEMVSEASTPIDEDIRTLLVTLEKMLLVLHAADYALTMNPQEFPEPLATSSPIGGHFIFHPPPAEMPKRNGIEYTAYWKDPKFDPLQSAVRVYERLGELGCPSSFFMLLIGLFPESCPSVATSPLRAPRAIHSAAATKSIPTCLMEKIMKRSPSTVGEPCSTLYFRGRSRLPLHMAIAWCRTWDEGVKSILDVSPSALSLPDGPTGLFPFMLAACSMPVQQGSSSSSLLRLGEGKRMVPVQSKPWSEAEQEERELVQVDTVFRLLLECPTLTVNNKMMYT